LLQGPNKVSAAPREIIIYASEERHSSAEQPTFRNAGSRPAPIDQNRVEMGNPEESEAYGAWFSPSDFASAAVRNPNIYPSVIARLARIVGRGEGPESKW
jgi:hypothetical protein